MRMVGREARRHYQCPCCIPPSWRAVNKKKMKRKEKQEWKREASEYATAA